MPERLTADVETLTERVDEIGKRSLKTAVLPETEVIHKLNLLYEGHETVPEKLDTLASKSRVNAPEADMALMKDAYRLMRLERSGLKKPSSRRDRRGAPDDMRRTAKRPGNPEGLPGRAASPRGQAALLLSLPLPKSLK